MKHLNHRFQFCSGHILVKLGVCLLFSSCGGNWVDNDIGQVDTTTATPIVTQSKQRVCPDDDQQLDLGLNNPNTERNISPSYKFRHDVDILFVIDNTSEMGVVQASLGRSIGALISKLKNSDDHVSYRMGFISTGDAKACDTTTDEGIVAQALPCTSRLEDFITTSLDGSHIDHQKIACENLCPDGKEFKILPTLSDSNKETARPWIEYDEGLSNIANSWPVEKAARCLAPQGINGCKFRTPLHSMASFIHESDMVRENANLAIVFVTNGNDCTYGKSHLSIFSESGEKVFWHDKANRPEGGICWRAGVSCDHEVGESASSYGQCTAQNYASDGSAISSSGDFEQSVLVPIKNYISTIGYLKEKEEVLVAVLSGVPVGFSKGDVLDYYFPENDSQAIEYGVRPGCHLQDEATGFHVAATPPVRLREFARAFQKDTEALYSVCEQDYKSVFSDIGDRIFRMGESACYACVKDMALATPGVQPECTMDYYPDGQSGRVDVLECEKDKEGHYLWDRGDYVLPSGEERCYVLLVDPDNETSDPHDKMTETCANLEIHIRRAKGVKERSLARYLPLCVMSDCPEYECRHALISETLE